MTRRSIDGRILQADPFLILMMVVPLLVITVVSIGTGPLLTAISRLVDLDIPMYTLLVEGTILAMLPLLLSIAPAFIVLDERDGGLIPLYNVSPRPYRAILRPRLLRIAAVLAAYTAIGISVFGYIGRPIESSGGVHAISAAILCILFSAVDVPIWTLLVTRFASNKITGMSLVKALSITAIVPTIHVALSLNGTLTAGVAVSLALPLVLLPGFWVMWSYLALHGVLDLTPVVLGIGVLGLALHIGTVVIIMGKETA